MVKRGGDLAVGNEIKEHPAFQEAVLVLDESAEQKAGEHSAEAGRQHNGRLGKVAMSQVGVFLALVTPNVWTWMDGALYFPPAWFEESHAERRKQAGVPEERVFQTKPEIGWELIQRAKERHIPFVAVAMDDLYGRNQQLRQRLNEAGIEYYGDIPADTKVYLEKPHITHPLTQRGEPSQTAQIAGTAYDVRQLRQKDDLEWQTLRLRTNERGYLEARFARLRVWVVMAKKPAKNGCLSARTPIQSLMFSVTHPKPSNGKRWLGANPTAISWNAPTRTPRMSSVGMNFKRVNIAPGSINSP